MFTSWIRVFVGVMAVSWGMLGAHEGAQGGGDEESFPFTGKIVGQKVRLRLDPSVESPILTQLKGGELVWIDGNKDGFYQIKPLEGMKGYVFRTYVLDGQVEGERVNMRVEPDLEAAVIAKLSTGDSIQGVIAQDNHKWLECAIPESTRFFVAQEYVEKVGGANYLAELESSKKEAQHLLSRAQQEYHEEFAKPFVAIDTQQINDYCRRIVERYGAHREVVEKALALEKEVAQEYLTKKIAYLEQKAAGVSQDSAVVSTHAERPVDSREQSLFASYMQQNPQGSWEVFYQRDLEHAQEVHGLIVPYARPVRNRPGDFYLISPTTQKPIAYLYSTKVALEELTTQGEQLLLVTPRPNNDFAYPAYFVHKVARLP